MAYQIDPSYKEVPERIRDFREKHPEGSLQSRVIFWPTSELPFIGVEAKAYRTSDDPVPGVGLAWEPFPGKTPYTKDSELQNAETSAWGRAIVAVLASESKQIASAEDVRNRGAAVDSASTPAATARKPTAGPGGGEDVTTPSNDGTPSPAGNGAFSRKPDDCPHERLEDAPREGFKHCPSCGAGGPARWFVEAEDSSRKTKTPLAKEKAPSA